MTTLSKLLAAALVFGAVPSFAADYQLDPAHTAAQFNVRHMMVSTVRGQFDRIAGTAVLDDRDLTRSSVNVTIEASSVNTREPKRDEHLRSPDFFDVAKFPTITFASTKVEKGAAGKYLVTGNLTMRGVSRPITLTVDAPTAPVKSPWGTQARGIYATGTLNRKDFGLTWNKALEAGGVLVGDEVQLIIDAELIPKGPKT